MAWRADADDGDEGTLVVTGGPMSVHHLLLALSPTNSVYLHDDPDEVPGGEHAAAALEIWQSLASTDGSRWRWYIQPKGRIVEEAPGDVHRLRLGCTVAMTVTIGTLPGREAVQRFRQGLREAGIGCVLALPHRARATAVAA